MFKVKSFQRRVLLALLAAALLPSALLLLVGTQLVRQGVEATGTAGPWGSLAESGQVLIQEVEEAELDSPEVQAAAEAHQAALSESLRYSRIFSLVAERFLGLVPLLALGLALLMGGLSYWGARQLSRGFSRPIRDLVGWTELIARDEPLPPPGPGDTRGVEEFSHLREALRSMASQLEEGRREAVQAAKLRSWTEMARRVAHELKNPLTPMQMAAFRVSRMDDPGAREAGEVLLEEIGRLDEMARTFSQFGRMPEGPPSMVDLGELIQELVRQHEGGDVHVSCSVQDDLPLVLGHYDALLRSIRNLVLNGVEAAGPGGHVGIRVTGRAGEVALEIQDSGPGIPGEELERIWEPEYTTKSSGTGLGLPMVRQTIRFHHGRVEGRNGTEGGAVFRVELPIGGPETP